MLSEDISKLTSLLEYMTGTQGTGTKYLSRFGTPGNYSYIYDNNKTAKYGRTKYRAFKRYLSHHKRFVNSINSAYSGNKMIVKTLSWHKQLATIHTQEGSQFKLGINLFNHKIRGYRSRLKGPNASAHLNSLKKRGILRYR